MATYEKIANLKGPKGNGVTNPRLSGDSLVLDVMDGTVKTGEVNLGSVRGLKGLGIANPRIVGDNLVADLKDGDTTTGTVTIGDVRGPVGPRGPLPTIAGTASTGDPGTPVQVTVTPTETGGAFAFRVPRGDIGATPTLTFTEPLNLAPGSQPLVNITQPTPGSYRVQFGLVQGAAGAASQSIKDTEISLQSSWSSQKTRGEIDALIDDSAVSTTHVYSSDKSTAVAVSAAQDAASGLIQPDPSPTAVYSSLMTDSKISGAIGAYVPAWGNLSGKPGSFPPSAHTHAAVDVTSGVFAAARLPAATEAAQGALEIATTAEIITGTDAVRAVTPRGIKQGYNLAPWRPDTVIIGSSNATGGATQWPAKVCAMMGWTERNFAVGGGAFSQNFSTMIDNASASTDFANADVGQVFIVDASNDTRAGTTIGTAVANVFQKAKATFPNARIICLPEIWPPDTTNVSTVPGGFQVWWWDKLAEHTDVMRRAARLYGIDYIDDSWTWFLGMTDLQKPNEVHLTTEGHTLIAQYVRSWLAGNDVRGRRPWTKVPATGGYYSTDDGLLSAGRGLRVIAEGNTVTARGLMSAAGTTAPDSDWAVVPSGFRPCFLTSIVLTQHSSGLVVPAKIYSNGTIRSNPGTNGGVFYVDATWQRA